MFWRCGAPNPQRKWKRLNLTGYPVPLIYPSVSSSKLPLIIHRYFERFPPFLTHFWLGATFLLFFEQEKRGITSDYVDPLFLGFLGKSPPNGTNRNRTARWMTLVHLLLLLCISCGHLPRAISHVTDTGGPPPPPPRTGRNTHGELTLTHTSQTSRQ